MVKVTRLEQPPMVEFCAVCLDEGKCADAGRCLFDAVTARDRAEYEERSVEPVPIRPNKDGG